MTYFINGYDKGYKGLGKTIKKHQSIIDKIQKEGGPYVEFIINFKKLQLRVAIIQIQQLIEKRTGQQ